MTTSWWLRYPFLSFRADSRVVQDQSKTQHLASSIFQWSGGASQFQQHRGIPRKHLEFCSFSQSFATLDAAILPKLRWSHGQTSWIWCLLLFPLLRSKSPCHNPSCEFHSNSKESMNQATSTCCPLPFGRFCLFAHFPKSRLLASTHIACQCLPVIE